MRRTTILAAAVLAAGGCGQQKETTAPAAPATMVRDIHSYAKPGEVRVTHLDLDWNVLFDRKVLEGSAVLHLARGEGAGQAPLRLDTRDLEIGRVTTGDGAEATWKLGERDPILGSELTIDLPAGADRVRIEYRTSPEASGLQWLDPPQTAGGKHPFLYTQSQAIHARSWIPCQDSPGLRVTFNATARVAPPLRAVMAAEPVSENDGVFVYRMTHPIPPYLLALAAGDLAFRQTGPRTGVWTEPPLLEKAAWEFADMEKMVAATERIYGPYRWGRYDLLVLPPSFPWGGMENPMLTFATPTILAGDRSLVALVAHELAHSWSGNLVTNATWSDFWLNEGFTTYIQQRIMEEVYGLERSRMEWMLGRQELERTLQGLVDKPGDQELRIDLTGRDPDDAATDVAYEKGALLLRLLEETYGREVFDRFLRSWFDEHAFTSVTTDTFVSFATQRLLDANEPGQGRTRPDLLAWIDGPGIPAGAPEFQSDALAKVDEEVTRWAAGGTPAKELRTGGWTTQHWLHFLRALPKEMTPRQMAELDDALGFTKTGNSEVLDEWLVLAVRHGYEPARPRLEQFLTAQGRRKYLRPIYEELVKSEEGKRRAMEIYTKARPLYQTVARQTIDKIVGWPPAGV